MSSPLSLYFNESSLMCNQLAKPVHCRLHITIIAHIIETERESEREREREGGREGEREKQIDRQTDKWTNILACEWHMIRYAAVCCCT